MLKSKIIISFLSASIILTSLMLISIPFVEAHPHTAIVKTESYSHQSNTEIIPLTGEIGIEKTILVFNAPADNTLPWGFVEGKIANHVANYPVIIQIYDEHGDATHFAQTDVEEDGSYEYRFRVRNVDNGEVLNIFEGDYLVKIFKVVYIDSTSNQV